MLELKKCPFCGGEAKVFVNDCVVIKCMKCHVQTTPRQDFCIADCEKFNAFEKAVEDWNRRPEDDGQ